MRQFERAVHQLQQLLREQGRNMELLVLLAEAYQGLAQHHQAVEVLREAAGLYEEEGADEEALAVLGRLLPIDESVWPREQQARILLNLTNKSSGGKAREFRSRALALYHSLADACPSGATERRLAYLQTIAALAPEDSEAVGRVAEMLTALEKQGEALLFLKRICRKLLEKGLIRAAEQTILGALATASQDIEAQALYLLIQVLDGTHGPGIRGLEQLHRQHPKSLEVHVALSEANLYLGRHGDGVKWLLHAYALDPALARNMMTLGRRMLAVGKVELAFCLYRPIAEHAIASDRLESGLDLMRGLLRVDAGHVPTLRWLAENCMKLAFHNQAALYLDNLIRLGVRHNRLESCRRFLETCFDEPGQNSTCREYLTRLEGMVAAG